MEDTASTTTSHALMLLIIWGFPWDVSVPSFSSMIGACWRTASGREKREREKEVGKREGRVTAFADCKQFTNHYERSLSLAATDEQTAKSRELRRSRLLLDFGKLSHVESHVIQHARAEKGAWSG